MLYRFIVAGFHTFASPNRRLSHLAVSSEKWYIDTMTSMKTDNSVNWDDSVLETHLSLPNRRQGKVRDLYSVPSPDGGEPRILMITSDRLSAFDVVLPTPIPGKGCILTDLSMRWFHFLRELNIIGDHVISTDPDDIPGLSDDEKNQIRNRMMLSRGLQIVPIECVVRGYLAGSGWAEYQQSQTICGIKLPASLLQCAQLPEPIFTPATKAESGHDENISFEQSCDVVGTEVMERLRDISIRLYQAAAKHAESCGLILADTKFEFGYVIDDNGIPTDELLLADEFCTPDSSRYWPADRYEPGRDQESFDKQYIRNYLQELVDAGKWDKTHPGPALSDNVVTNTLARYVEARKRLFG